MSDRWVESPTHLPRRCHRTGTSSEEAGPYFEHNWSYYDADPNAAANMELRNNTLYQSREWIKHMLSQPGSPYVPVTSDEWADANMNKKELADRVEELEAKVVDLQEDLIVALAREPIVLRDEDVERIAVAMRPKPRVTK